MKKFQCYYTDRTGSEGEIEESKQDVKAPDAVHAAVMFSRSAPDERFPLISVRIRNKHQGNFNNPVYLKRKELDTKVDILRALAARVKDAEGALEGLPYTDLMALIENMKDFPTVRDELDSEERDIREHLYKMAFFDSNLQRLLQTDLLRNVKSSCEDLLEVLVAHTKTSKGSNKNALLGTAAGLAALNDIRENTE